MTEKNIVLAKFENRLFYGKYPIDAYGPGTGNAYPEMKYHTSWDWLMPVWEKFRDMEFDTSEHIFRHRKYKDCIDKELSYGTIECAHLVIYKAIQWYNESKKINCDKMRVPEKYRLTTNPLLPSDSSYGNNGAFIIPHYRINNYEIRCIASDGSGWEHVSVTIAPVGKTANRCPTWEEMCWVKGQFWNDDVTVIQYHPAKEDYVSQHDFCLHLWRPIGKDFPTPNPLMVGINKPA